MKSKKQYGGNFNSIEIKKIKKKLKQIGFTNEEIESNNFIGRLNEISQRFTGPRFNNLMDMIQNAGIHTLNQNPTVKQRKQSFINKLNQESESWEGAVETDSEDDI